MTDPAAGRWVRFRRIVLALDATPMDRTVVDRVAALAAQLRTEMTALYVEDIDLVRLAEHGSISALSTVTAAPQHLGTGRLRETLRLRASNVRRELHQLAERRRVKCAFQTRQGRLLAEVLRLAGDDDLVVLGWTGARSTPPWAASAAPGIVARALTEASARSVLLLHPGAPASGPVLIAFDGSVGAWHALSLGAQVAELEKAAVEIALLAAPVNEVERSGREIESLLAASRQDVTFLHAPRADLDTLTDLALKRRANLLVLNAERAYAENEGGRRSLQRLACSVLLVR